MATTGAKIAGTGTNVLRGTGTSWTNPGNITANDNTNASCAAGNSGSSYLRGSNFAFNLPANSLIQGFTVVVEMAESSAGSEVISVQLVGAAGTAIGTAKTFTANGTALTAYTLGSGTDLWGTTGLTSTDLNDTDFGVYIWYTTAHSTTVDYISIDVNYEPPRSGSLDVTEAGADALSVNGKVSSSGVSGSFSATEVGSDSLATSALITWPPITGSLNALNESSDTLNLTATVLVQGSLGGVEAGHEQAVIEGIIPVSGQLAVTEVGTDFVVNTGFITTSITGAFSASEGSGLGSVSRFDIDTDQIVELVGETGAVIVSSGATTPEVVNNTGSLAAFETIGRGGFTRIEINSGKIIKIIAEDKVLILDKF